MTEEGLEMRGAILLEAGGPRLGGHRGDVLRLGRTKKGPRTGTGKEVVGSC